MVTVSPAAAIAAGSAGLPAVNPGAFPAATLGMKVQLLLGGVWTDITRYVRTRNPVQITGGGRADWTSTLQAAQLSLTLANDGRFTPKNASGAYYPNITRNVQVRVSVTAQSSTGVTYTGYRFWGEVSEWPPSWDVSGRDVYVDVTAAGIWRRMSQLQTTLGSAYRRYTSALSGIRSYWPMEDGTGSGQLVAYTSVAGTANAVQSFLAGQPGLSLAADTSFKGSDGIPQFNAAKIICTVPGGGTPTNNVTRFLLSVPAAGDSASGGGNWCIAEIKSAGTAATFEVYLLGDGTLKMQLVNASAVVIASGTTTTNVKGQPYLVSCELTPSGGNVAFALRIIQPGASGITESMTGTLTTATVGAITTVTFDRANILADTAVGHCYVSYSAPQTMVGAAYALNGYAGELAADRFTRICGEMGIAAELTGTASSTAAMGPQLDDTLTNVLQQIEDTDCGLLFESRSQFGIGYRANASMADQAAAVSLAYTAGVLDPALQPAYDDSLTRNNVTVTNYTGYTVQSVLTSGAMSVSNPPNGIGNGYSYQRSISAAADTQVQGIANWLLNVGASDEIRFPTVTFRLAKASLAPYFSSLPGLRPGDYLAITAMPAWMPAGTVKQLTWGYAETLGTDQWDLTYNTVPEAPWETGYSAGTALVSQIPGGSPVTSTAPGTNPLSALIANGGITPVMLNEGITVKTLGGSRITVGPSPPSTADTGDIWVNSATAVVSSWNGTAWVAYPVDGSTIQAGTIVAGNIAAGTITAALLAAGIIKAGIVDGTTISGAQFIAYGTSGEILIYSGTPATGNLIGSWSGLSGTDGLSNSYPAGIGVASGGLNLANQASAPASIAGTSVVYSGSGGRLRYINQAGVDLVVDRSGLNLTNFTMGTQTIPQPLSGPLNYQANEANVGSEYEIEIDGTCTSPNTTTAAWSFDFFIDGAQFTSGTNVPVSGGVMQTALTYAFTCRYRATVNSTGAAGTVTIAMDGAMTRKGAQVGQTTFFATLNNVVASAPFDTTANHTLKIYCNWGATTGTGHSAITYRTKIVRRN